MSLISAEAEDQLRIVVEELNKKGISVPSSVSQIKQFPYASFKELQNSLKSGEAVLLRFAFETLPEVYNLFNASAALNFNLIIAYVLPLISVGLAFFYSWWCILGVFFFFIGMSRIKRLYNETVFQAAMTNELAFCFLFYLRQISVSNTNRDYQFYFSSDENKAKRIPESPQFADYESYHDALDEIVKNLQQPLTDVLKHQNSTDKKIVPLASEMIAYGLACYARKELHAEIPLVSWNSFKASVEYRVVPYLSDEFISAVESARTPPAPNTFVSYTTPAFGLLQRLESLALEKDSQEQARNEIFLDVFSILRCETEEEHLGKLNDIMEASLDTCLNYIVPNIQEVFS